MYFSPFLVFLVNFVLTSLLRTLRFDAVLAVFAFAISVIWM